MVKPMQRLQNRMPQKISGLVLSKPVQNQITKMTCIRCTHGISIERSLVPFPLEPSSRVSRFGGQVPGAAAEHLREVDRLCTEEVGESAAERHRRRVGWLG